MHCGGDAPERDAVEEVLLKIAMDAGIPVLGVCRGMQVILDHFGAVLQPVKGHVASEQSLEIEGTTSVVNSYHDWGTTEAPECLDVWARAADGVIKAVRHGDKPLCGIMWHPERIHPFRKDDVQLLKNTLGTEARS